MSITFFALQLSLPFGDGFVFVSDGYLQQRYNSKKRVRIRVRINVMPARGSLNDNLRKPAHFSLA